MLLRVGRNKKQKKQAEEEALAKAKAAAATEDSAAVKIQCMVRRFLAKRRVIRMSRDNFVRVYDPVYKRYFWYDQLHEKSTWKKPSRVELYTAAELESVPVIQRFCRGFTGRARARKLANQKYTRFYDAETSSFYWVENATNKTTYKASNWLQRQNIAMPSEDKLLLQSQLRIKELERKLAEKDAEIKQIRKKRYEELEPEVIQDKVKNARNIQRSRHMDEWSIDDVAAWFTELKMEEYIPTLFTNRVDGLLFVNLSDEEITDLGITNKFHFRKLQLILKSYRIRFHQKKERRAGNRHNETAAEEDDELLSEYSPSELSAIIAAEEADNDQLSDQQGSDDDFSIGSGEDEVEKITEEQRLQKRMDETNITLERVMDGDNENFPIIGDLVRVKYTCSLAGSNAVRLRLTFKLSNVKLSSSRCGGVKSSLLTSYRLFSFFVPFNCLISLNFILMS